MKIIRNSTYNRLVANGRNLDLLTEKYRKLELEHKVQSGANDHLESELDSRKHEVVLLKRELDKWRPRRGQGGKFQKKDN